MDVVEELERRGGLARARTLREGGVSDYALRRAKERGEIAAVGRGWVATTDADPMAVGAASRGAVLSCVTAAERAGLWMPDSSALHVAVRPNAARVRVPAQVVVHWSRPIVPREPDAIVDGLVNALALVATCQPFESALAIWESAMNKKLVDAGMLRGLDLPVPARAVLERARPFADSGLETIVVHRLRWLGIRMLAQAWVEGRRVDVLLGERLVIQLDGATHTGAQRDADITHDAALMLRGYHVLRFSYTHVMHRWHDVQSVVMHAVAQGKHRA